MAENKKKSDDIAYNNGSIENIDIIEEAKKLNQAFVNCSLYKNYIKIKEELSRQPLYHEKVDNFRKKQISFEISKRNNEHCNDIDELSLSNEYADLCLIAACNDFFQAEMELLSLTKDMLGTVCCNIDIDMEFLTNQG